MYFHASSEMSPIMLLSVIFNLMSNKDFLTLLEDVLEKTASIEMLTERWLAAKTTKLLLFTA